MAHFDDEPELRRVGDEMLGAAGVLARSLPNYEPRRPQVEMANLCGQAIEEQKHALMEAGTGTGKSFAYLVAAILSGKKVVVSTDTIALQEQLIQKDLPFLAKVLGRSFTYAIAKGRSNYFCERNALALTEELPLTDLTAFTADQCLAEFRSSHWNGDKANLRLAIPDIRWGTISGDESCTGRSCPQKETCPYLIAKALYEDADIIITNHTMYLLHHYVMQRTGGITGILPSHTVWIADEAHTLADKCVDVFGVEITHTRPASLLKRLNRQAKVLDLDLGDLDTHAVHRAANLFFESFHGAMKEQMLLREFPPEIVELAEERMGALVHTLKPIRLALYWATQKVDPDNREKLGAIERLYSAVDLLIEGLTDIFATTIRCSRCLGAGMVEDDEGHGDSCPQCDGDKVVPDTEHVVYVEVSANRLTGDHDVSLHRKPIETRPIFREILNRVHSALFTSATLATGKGLRAWAPVADELGLHLPSTLTYTAESPFDYANQVVGYVPAGLPEARSPEYHTAVADELTSVLHYTLGRAFVLFTSRRDMERVYELVKRAVRFPILKQGDMPKDELVRQFKETENAVLFGLKTFWAGVDIPGDQLSCVILVKLPFPQFDHPLNKARCERIKARGGSDFGEFTLPRCIRDVKQGFGRLIRTRTDEGVFVILDPRMRSQRYGTTIADALPNFPCVSRL